MLFTSCGAVPKDEDPFGRIGHNFGHLFDGLSLDDVLEANSVSFISCRDRARLLSQMTWHFKVDLKTVTAKSRLALSTKTCKFTLSVPQT